VGHRQLAPPVVIEQVQADGRSVYSALGGGEAEAAPRRLRIGPGARNLEIRYSAPNLSSPELIQFRYRLAELDSDWLDAGLRRSITFPRLPPGEYRFQVSARNSDGVWSSHGDSLAVEVLPFFYERKSFIAAMVLLVAGTSLVTVRRLTKQRMQRRLDQLERQRALERERSRIAQDLHDDLGAGLTEISLTADLVRSPDLDPDAAQRYVGEIGGKARELVASMDEIVWAVNPRNNSLSSLAAYFCQSAQHLLVPAGIRCRLAVDENLPAAPLDSEQRHQLFLAFKEALNNIVRHSGAKEVSLSIRVEMGQLVVALRDDGRGFVASPTVAGADGLRNMRERLQRIGGACDVVSQPGAGTSVDFRVRLAVPETGG
jgi:signal transduction histidine kinase